MPTLRLAPSTLVSLLSLVALASACEPAAVPAVSPEPAPPSAVAVPPPASASSDDIGALHRARCGACHVRVEPAQRSREVLVAALARHRKRVHLSEPQWSALIDYLAPAAPPPLPPG
jgi:hypothetical protein